MVVSLQGLVFYAHNSPATNAAIAAMLERISSPDALDLEPMLYQVCVCVCVCVVVCVTVSLPWCRSTAH